MNPNPHELLSSTCPVCQGRCAAVEHTRTTVNRKKGAAGGPQVDVSTEAVEQHEGFECGLERLRLFENGRWSQWSLEDDRRCDNSQQVALELRQQLNEARSTGG